MKTEEPQLNHDREVYMNPAQKFVLWVFARTMIIFAGRGMGKGLILAAFMLKCIQRMPGCTGCFVSVSLKRAFTNTLPSIITHWEKWGYPRDVAWVIGRKPPKNLGFKQPLLPVENWENVITFYNGSQIIIISQDRDLSSNGLTLDFIAVDEGKSISYKKLKDETMPCNRGNEAVFGRHSCHHAMCVVSDMSVTSSGNWMMDYKKKCDEKVIELIMQCQMKIFELKKKLATARLKKEKPKEYINNDLRWYSRALEQLRARAVLYKEYSSIENLQVLGRGFIERMKRDLSPLTFKVCILGQRCKETARGFYSALSEKHYYHSSNAAAILAKTHQLSADERTWDMDAISSMGCESSDDLDPAHGICIGMDYNANINCLVAGQPGNRKLNVVKSFFVKYERKIPELIDDFCTWFAAHPTKIVVFYYDNTALGGNYAVNDEDFKYVIIDELQKHGWIVIDVYLGQAMGHMEKHLLINRCLRGEGRLIPMFNYEENEDLIAAMENAGVYGGKKDKRGEKEEEPDDGTDPLERRTDITDALDTLVIGCERFPQTEYFGFTETTIIGG